MDELKQAFANLYSNSSDNVVILNNGIRFQESSNTSVEMQLNENEAVQRRGVCEDRSYTLLPRWEARPATRQALAKRRRQSL